MMSDYLKFIENLSEEEEEVRICEECDKVMNEGYCIDGGLSYYCSDECLNKNISHETYMELHAIDGAYWTKWD